MQQRATRSKVGAGCKGHRLSGNTGLTEVGAASLHVVVPHVYESLLCCRTVSLLATQRRCPPRPEVTVQAAPSLTTLRSSVYDTVRRTPRSIIAHTKREVELNSEVAAAIVMLGGGPPMGP
jgi:hypothetical protein